MFLTIPNHLIYDMNIDDGIAAGRFHHQWMPDAIDVESKALEPATIDALKRMGHKINLGEN